MTLSPSQKGLGVLAACCISYVIGRGTQKTVAIEKIREVEKVAEQKVEAAKNEATTAKSQAEADKVQWRTRTVYLPGGTVEVVKEVVREVEKRSAATATQVVTKVETREKLVFRDREVAISSPRPSWAVGAGVGLGLDGRLRYGGQLEHRLAGPLWFTAGVDVPTRGAQLGLRWEF